MLFIVQHKAILKVFAQSQADIFYREAIQMWQLYFHLYTLKKIQQFSNDTASNQIWVQCTGIKSDVTSNVNK